MTADHREPDSLRGSRASSRTAANGQRIQSSLHNPRGHNLNITRLQCVLFVPSCAFSRRDGAAFLLHERKPTIPTAFRPHDSVCPLLTVQLSHQAQLQIQTRRVSPNVTVCRAARQRLSQGPVNRILAYSCDQKESFRRPCETNESKLDGQFDFLIRLVMSHLRWSHNQFIHCISKFSQIEPPGGCSCPFGPG
jgi:hypothetical protein